MAIFMYRLSDRFPKNMPAILVHAVFDTVFINPDIYIYIYISVRFRKNVVARFSPRFRRSPNPGQASDSKPRGGGGGGAPSRLAWVYSPGLHLSAGGLFGVQRTKAGGWGGGGCILLTPFAVLTLRFYSVYL